MQSFIHCFYVYFLIKYFSNEHPVRKSRQWSCQWEAFIGESAERAVPHINKHLSFKRKKTKQSCGLATLYARKQNKKTFWLFLKAMTHLPHWPHIFLTSLTPDFNFWVSPKEWELTEQGSIQLEVTLSGRRNLTSCSTHSTEDQPPVLSEHARRRLLLGFT